jgi:hypothetical protein
MPDRLIHSQWVGLRMPGRVIPSNVVAQNSQGRSLKLDTDSFSNLKPVTAIPWSFLVPDYVSIMIFVLISPCIVNQFLKMFQQDDTFFVQYFIPCKRLYMFRVKHSPIIRSSNKL